MERGEFRPSQEVFQQFDAGLPGAVGEGDNNQYWQRIARTYRIERTAQRFGIPERSWNHPTIHSFVEATLDARDLQNFMTIRQMHLDFDMEPSLSERYTDGELLMRGVSTILEYNLDGQAVNLSDYLASKVGLVTRRFGVMVTHLPEAETQLPEAQIPTAMPGSAWADYQTVPTPDLYRRYVALHGSENFKLWCNEAPRQNSTREDESRLRQTAQLLGIPEQNIAHPRVHEFLSNLHYMEDLLKILEQGEMTPGAAGLTPSVAERYQMAAHLMHVGIAIIEEGFQGRTVEPQFVANHVDSALSYFGLQARLQIEG
jgi:hypothetical protein